jgi:hypothetical protein
LYCPDAGSADPHPPDVRRQTASESHTDTEIWLQLPPEEEEEEVVVEVGEGEEVVMMEIPIVLVLREMLRPETGVTAPGAGVRLAGVPAGVSAEVRVAVPRLREEEEVPEEEVEAVEVQADEEVQAIPAMAHAAGVEAEIADAEYPWGQTNPSTRRKLGKVHKGRDPRFPARNCEFRS